MKSSKILVACFLVVCVVASTIVMPSSAALTLSSGKTSGGSSGTSTGTSTNTSIGNLTLIGGKTPSSSNAAKEKAIYEDMLKTMAKYEEEITKSERNISVDTSDSVLGSRSSVSSKITLVNKKTIKSIKTLKSFSGDTYTLVECSPVGYMIYHNASGIFVEYSYKCNSPFTGATGELYYNGLNDYYSKNIKTNVYTDLASKEVADSSQVEASTQYGVSCSKQYLDNADKYTLDYVSGKTTVLPSEQKALEESLALNASLSSSETSTKSNSTKSFNSYITSVFVPNSYYLDSGDLINNGYVSGGKCGMICAGMLMYYNSRMGIKSYLRLNLDYRYVEDNGTDGAGWVIASHVVNRQVRIGRDLGYFVGSNYGTNVLKIKNIITKYVPLYSPGNITPTHDFVIPELYHNTVVTHTQFWSRISAGHPSIGFGDQDAFGGVQNHAVLVYGMIKEGFLFPSYTYVAHFTWEYASLVFFTQPQRGLYTCY